MKPTSSLNDLLLEELSDLLNAESQWAEALPQMVQASQWPLKAVLENQRQISQKHASRLQDIFSNAGQNPHRGMAGRTIKEFIKEGHALIGHTDDGQERDTAIIGVSQKVEQYKIAAYGTAREHAENIGHSRIVEVLDETINEERTLNLNLNELAQELITKQYTQGSTGGTEES